MACFHLDGIVVQEGMKRRVDSARGWLGGAVSAPPFNATANAYVRSRAPSMVKASILSFVAVRDRQFITLYQSVRFTAARCVHRILSRILFTVDRIFIAKFQRICINAYITAACP